MRSYGIIAPEFWTGDTGRALREAGRDAQVLALYLLSSPHANMIGLYYLPIAYISNDIGSPFEGASEALRRVEETGFAFYDLSQQCIFIPEFARYQIGESLKPTDNRISSVLSILNRYRKCKFFNDFYQKYKERFCLPDLNQEAPPKPLRSPSEAPPKPLRSQEQEQEQEQEEKACSELGSPASEPPREEQKPVLVFHCVGDLGDWNLYQTKIDEWQKTFPGLNVEAECRRAWQWAEDNPKKRKTPKGMTKYLFTWLSKSQDSPRPTTFNQASESKPPTCNALSTFDINHGTYNPVNGFTKNTHLCDDMSCLHCLPKRGIS